jgi:uncharacterized protein YjbI with pentapeptide repeats/uncharacterized RDD family membrane protein YckC
MAPNSINTNHNSNPRNHQDQFSIPESKPKFRLVIPLGIRRGAAILVEVSLVAAAAVVPLGLGQGANERFKEKVPLNPVLVEVQESIAQTLALPRNLQPLQVAPLTNLLWSGALLLPILWGGTQLIFLMTTGQTSPKRWFAVAVVRADGSPPGLLRVMIREGLGRWGLPIATAYGLWRYTGSFPDLSILLILVGGLIVIESATVLFDRRRSFHDRLAGTYVVDVEWLEEDPESAETEEMELDSPGQSVRERRKRESIEVNQQINQQINQQVTYIDGHLVVEQIPLSAAPVADFSEDFAGVNFSEADFSTDPRPSYSPDPNDRPPATPTITTITLPASRAFHLWSLMRRYPGATLLTALVGSISLVLGTFVGTQVYIQGETNQRNFQQQQNQVFLSLVNQLNRAGSVEERKGVILALGRIEDHRVVPFLVDLLAREKSPSSIETIEQALVANGLISLPPLQKLSQTLQNDLQTAIRRAIKEEQDLVITRQKSVARSIAKILTISVPTAQKINLSKVDFSSIPVVLEGLDLAGINFQGTNLFNANLRYGQFFNAGEDKIEGTYDDRITDFFRANLQQADLTGARATRALMVESNISWSAINKADFSDSNLTRANLSGAQIINSQFSHVNLEQASLTGANIGDSQFIGANFAQANLGKARAINSNFSRANLTKTNWQLADASQGNFSGADLEGADLSNSKLVGANFTGANFQNANFQNADLRFADLRGTNLAGADFLGVVFFTPPSADPDQFIRAVIPKESSTMVQQVDFSRVKNLDRRQLTYLCSQGAIHPNCP